MSTRIAAADRWRRLLRLQRSSGLSISAFCRREGVSQPSFYSWRRKLQAEAVFAEVKLVPELPARSPDIELRLPGRFRVVVRPGFDRRTLLELLHTLEDHSSARSAREAGA
jgi:transposase-like protein